MRRSLLAGALMMAVSAVWSVAPPTAGAATEVKIVASPRDEGVVEVQVGRQRRHWDYGSSHEVFRVGEHVGDGNELRYVATFSLDGKQRSALASADKVLLDIHIAERKNVGNRDLVVVGLNDPSGLDPEAEDFDGSAKTLGRLATDSTPAGMRTLDITSWARSHADGVLAVRVQLSSAPADDGKISYYRVRTGDAIVSSARPRLRITTGGAPGPRPRRRRRRPRRRRPRPAARCRRTVPTSPARAGLIASTPRRSPRPRVSWPSRRNKGVFWIHNDSGGKNRVFAVDISGRVLGEYRLEGADARDWEDIAVGPGPRSGTSYLYVGDVGDNANRRGDVQVYRVAEPSVSTGRKPAKEKLSGVERINLRYENPHDHSKTISTDVEGILVDPLSGDLFIFGKDLRNLDGKGERNPIWRASKGSLRGGATVRMDHVASIRGRVDSGGGAGTVAGRHLRRRAVDHGEELLRGLRLAPLAGPVGSTRRCGPRPRRPVATTPAVPSRLAILPDSSGFLTVREGKKPDVERWSLTW